MSISGRQIRAARGLMGWSMGELAQKAGITTITVRSVESDAVQPQEKTLAKIMTVFDKAGIEFQEDEGVKIRKHQTRSYSGKAGYRQLLDHIYATLKGGGRVCQFNFGDIKYLPYADDFVTEHLKRMDAIKGLDARVLAMEGDTNLHLSYCSYRYLDNTYADMTPYYVYGDYLIMSLNDGGNKVELLSIQSKVLAERYVREFDAFWEKAKEAKKKRNQ